MDNAEAKTAQAALSAFLAVLSCYGGVVAVPLVVLMVVMVIDYITGMVSAWHSADLSSRKGLFGIVKKNQLSGAGAGGHGRGLAHLQRFAGGRRQHRLHCLFRRTGDHLAYHQRADKHSGESRSSVG